MKLALALAALSFAGTADAVTVANAYSAVGHAPEWRLRIDRGIIRFVGDDGKARITVRAPRPRIGFAGERYATARITVDVLHATCRDAVTREDWSDRVTVTIGRRTLHGCGGRPISAGMPTGGDMVTLAGTTWRIARIDGAPVATPRPTRVSFTTDRIEGNAGCNAFGGAYRIDHGLLTTSGIVSTRMACVGGGMTVERRFMSIVAGPARLIRQGDTLTVSANDGTITLRR